MKLIKKNGLLLITNIMFGDIDDTEETLQQTIDFAKPYSDHFAICLTTPLPGTEYWRVAKEQGRIKVWDYSKYDMLNPVMNTRTLSIERIRGDTPEGDTEVLLALPRLLGRVFFSETVSAEEQQVLRQDGMGDDTHKPWVQKNYVPFEKYMEEKTGKPFARVHL